MAAQADNVDALGVLVEETCRKAEEEENEESENNKPSHAVFDDDHTITSASVRSHNDDDSLSMVRMPRFELTQNAEVMEFLNLPSKNLTTPLHIACLNNSQRVVQFLLTHKVRVDFKDGSGDTALHKAGRKQLNGIYQLLLRAGASESIKNNYGETPRDLLIDNPTY